MEGNPETFLLCLYTYVSFSTVGSSGGAGSSSSPGGRGGGIFALYVNHTLDIEGTIRANGDKYGGAYAGGGSGGSILIRTTRLEGSGLIQVSCRCKFLQSN